MGSVDLSSLTKGTGPFLASPSGEGRERGGAYNHDLSTAPPIPLSCCIFCEAICGLRSPKSGVPDRTDGTEPGRWDDSGNQSASLACRAENHNHNRRTGLSSRLGLADFPDFRCALTKIGVSWIPPHLPMSDSCRAGVAEAPSTYCKVVNHGPLYM